MQQIALKLKALERCNPIEKAQSEEVELEKEKEILSKQLFTTLTESFSKQDEGTDPDKSGETSELSRIADDETARAEND